jgi:hypothetical protein
MEGVFGEDWDEVHGVLQFVWPFGEPRNGLKQKRSCQII